MDELAEKALMAVLEYLRQAIREELEAQGHRATGKLIDSIDLSIEKTKDGWSGKIWMEDYGGIVDTGVPANRVPFSPGSGKKSSKYIDALIAWIGVVKPGLSDRETKSFAFAIAHKAIKEGHPTRGSYAFSQNGRRTEWARFSVWRNEAKIRELLDLGDYVALLVEDFFSQVKKSLVL